MGLAFRSGKVDNMSFYICRANEDSEEYKASVTTKEGPKEKICPTFPAAIEWVNGILEEEKKDEIERDRH